MAISALENFASGTAIERCVASTISHPPPYASPFTAAITGF